MTHAVPPGVTESVEQILLIRTGDPVRVKSYSPVGGGCINDGGRITTSAGDFFIKWNSARKYPGMFQTEAGGLSLLAGADTLRIPEVIASGESSELQYLLLEFIEPAQKSDTYWHVLGRGLAQLHRSTASLFGLGHDNYIGALKQSNTQGASWVEFFIHQRLNLQLGLAGERTAARLRRKFDELFRLMPTLLPDEKPSLLHGDLWSGNVIVDDHGMPCLIDPAVYYGHREVDLAMTTLFGGFPRQFYEAYMDEWPLDKGYENRFKVYNLYPLLVHMNLFGGHYESEVASVLDSVL